jgi:hypothetical protein
MKTLLILAILSLMACAPVQILEGKSGINSTPVYDGDCALDHFKDYFNCAALQTGGEVGD